MTAQGAFRVTFWSDTGARSADGSRLLASSVDRANTEFDSGPAALDYAAACQRAQDRRVDLVRVDVRIGRGWTLVQKFEIERTGSAGAA